jgi:DNA-binding NtrC family response regulator
VQVEDLGISGLSRPVANVDGDPQLFHDRLEAFKRRLVREALDACGGNLVHAARHLGVDRGTIRRLAAEQ